MKEQTFYSSIDASLPAVEPNFDDELTVMLARPVVPLQKIEAKERHRRRWLLGGAFALAMMLGAASALLASYLKLRNVPTVATEMSEVDASAMPVAVAAEPATIELPLPETTEEAVSHEEGVNPEEEVNPEEAVTSDTPKRAPVARRRAIVPRSTDLVRPRTVGGMDDEDELERIREAVLIDAWEERRARRAARRERRNRVDHHDRDLSNLDEIFEGRRRRNRP